MKFYAEGNTKTVDQTVAEIKRGEIPAGEDDTWSGVEMIIPPLPPSNLEFCRIIDIDYVLEVRLTNFVSARSSIHILALPQSFSFCALVLFNSLSQVGTCFFLLLECRDCFIGSYLSSYIISFTCSCGEGIYNYTVTLVLYNYYFYTYMITKVLVHQGVS